METVLIYLNAFALSRGRYSCSIFRNTGLGRRDLKGHRTGMEHLFEIPGNKMSQIQKEF